ncbi:uncharacterized protein N7473_000498 [Penicillium subrubescens]|jgi:hypothetical protein|uniref:GPI anchored cell wall protein n=1 Tax=Penicillium subrubescens TaxID=1316194 RepID=A0A1Q5SUA6_9EURO|nr:uncharacterized protein N7473_000498 [Penicillium subrubescens]KAJ5911195.1 hypothetical protein N7473_000498 [Penicillium subrubescens]OKO91598.1 hypothetical protein PENSUB_13005 [Penicillium subrubescens]
MHFTTTILTLLPTLALAASTATTITTAPSSTPTSSTSSDPSTTVISYFGASYTFSDIPVRTSTSYAASVISINALATTYQINCLPSAHTTDCTLATPLTLIAGPNTFSFKEPFTVSVEVAGVTVTEKGVEDMACSFTHSTESATCTLKFDLTASGAGKTTSTSVKTTTAVASDQVLYQTLTVTGGLASFTAPAATQTPTGNGGVQGVRAMVTGVPLGAAAVAVAVLL